MDSGTGLVRFSFSETYGACTPFTYFSSLSDGSTLPDFIEFDPILETYYIDTANESDVGLYQI